MYIGEKSIKTNSPIAKSSETVNNNLPGPPPVNGNYGFATQMGDINNKLSIEAIAANSDSFRRRKDNRNGSINVNKMYPVLGVQGIAAV
jgi:hypothetical protein